MHEIQFIRDLACVMLAAGVVVVVFPRLRLPVLLGYIVAGVLIGPHMPWRFLTDQRTMGWIRTFASCGRWAPA